MNGSDLIQNGEIVLDGDVVPNMYVRYYDGGAFSAQMVREALAEFSGDVRCRVNSPGGSPTEGEAIRAAFEAHEGEVTCIIEGTAMSAASLMIMSADRIEMSSGSVMMIHDPSTITFGTEADHLQAAEMLTTLASAYSAVYAAKARITADEARTIMREETFYSAQEAVDAGFADSIVGVDDATPVDPPSNPPEMFAAALTRMRSAAQQNVQMRDQRSDPTPGNAGQTPAQTATTMETTLMPPENQPTPQLNPATPPVDADAIRMQAVTDERERVAAIRTMAAPFMVAGDLTTEQIEGVINEGTTASMAGERLLAVMATSRPSTGTSGGAAVITRDETDTQLEGMIGALMRNYDGPAEQYRGLRLRGLAMALGGNNGRGFDDLHSIQSGMRSTTMMGGAHGVSDFAYITTEVMNRTLIAQYERRGAGWEIVTGAPISASDFREQHAVRFGGDFQLKDVAENGEYQEATLDDEAEGLKVQRKGRKINITFEAVVNDDMSAFSRIPMEFAVAARVMESGMVWALLRSNAVLKSDNKRLFHADHGNLAANGSAINVTSVAAGRKAMWEQKAFGSKDKDDFLSVNPDQLIVPPSLERPAMQFVSATTPVKDEETNPFKSLLTSYAVPNLGASAGGSDSAWYLTSSDLPPISVARLQGYEAPTVTTLEGMNPDKVTMQARHIFGAAPSEFRGVYKNPGQ